MIDGIWEVLGLEAKGPMFPVLDVPLPHQRLLLVIIQRFWVREEVGGVELDARLVRVHHHHTTTPTVLNSTQPIINLVKISLKLV